MLRLLASLALFGLAAASESQEACVESGGTWMEDSLYCLYPSPPPPVGLEHPGLAAAGVVGPAGVVGGPAMCCMAYNFQCLRCTMGGAQAALVLWGKQIAVALATPAGPISAPRACCRAYTFECLRCQYGVFRALFMMIGI